MTAAEMLLAAPGIENYPALFPRLNPRHSLFLGDTSKARPNQLAAVLTAAGRRGPVTPAAAAEEYRKAGELDSLLVVAPDQVAPATAEWQRRTEAELALAEGWARLCDRERVPTPDGQTWKHMVAEVRGDMSDSLAGSPGVVSLKVQEYQKQMQVALGAERERLRHRLDDLKAKLAQRGAALDPGAAERAGGLLDRVTKHIKADDLFLAVQRLEEVEAILASQTVTSVDRPQRHPLPTRTNPFPTGGFHFEPVVNAAKAGPAALDGRGLRRFLPDDDAIQQAYDPEEFLALHASRRVPNRDAYAAYFKALFRWLGIGQQMMGRARLIRLDTPNLEPRGEPGQQLPGRWVFLSAEPWQGAPFYDDQEGRPRLLAVVRLGVPDDKRTNHTVVVGYAATTLQALFTNEPVTADERRFRQEGLVLVLLPGAILSTRPYSQFQQEVRLPPGARADRIGYLDDLDLLRILPVRADSRFRALLELALPRFSAAVSVTYQNADAVRPRMFYGRTDEIAKVENGTTVVFSGRRMGKSSLLRRLQTQWGRHTDQRAVMVGCAAIGVGRSWQVLVEVERELAALTHREEGGEGATAAVPAIAPTTDATADAERAKDRFRAALDSIMPRLEARGVRQVYVLLDEADNFVRAELEENSGRRAPRSPVSRSAVSWFLRDLQTTTYRGRLRFIFAGYDQIGRMFRDPGLGESAFGHWGERLNLGLLDRESARSLVIEPLTALGMPVSPDIADRILDYTSRHASLIQVFGRKLAEHIREWEPNWPLNDVAVKFEHLIRIAEDERGDSNFRQLLEQTLGLNLDIARAYPLRFVFLALVTPGGLGGGKILGAGPFTTAEVLDQLHPLPEAKKPWPELPDSLVADSLVLLAQLGLLEEPPPSEGARVGRAYRFLAWHFVTVLRSRNGLQAELRQAADDWAAGGRRLSAEPRCVWTLPDADLHALRRLPLIGPSVVVGLPRSGRDYTAAMLGSPLADGAEACRLSAAADDFADRLRDWLAGSPTKLAVVADPADAVPWEDCRGWLRAALTEGRPLRWVGGARLAWDLAGDLDLSIELGALCGLGPLTVAEIEPWTARPLGTDGPGSKVTVHLSDADGILRHTGGLLPILELFREWLSPSRKELPDPLPARVAVDYLKELTPNSKLLNQAIATVAAGIPLELRAGLHHLFLGAAQYDFDTGLPSDWMAASEELRSRGPEFTTRVLDAGRWLGFVTGGDAAGRLSVLYKSALGLIVRSPRFAPVP